MIYRFFLAISLAFMVFGLSVSGSRIVHELTTIILSPDYLLTDYMALAGVGGAFFNSGFLMLLFTGLLKLLRVNPSGASIAAVMTIGGFALFGKNFFNVWPIVAGVFLYTALIGENMRTFLYVAYFGTALAPISTHLILASGFNVVGLFLSLLVGFLLPPLASFCLTLHRGYNLYNVGFTAGILGMFLGSILKAYDLAPTPRFYWYEGHQVLLAVFTYAVFYSTLLYGLKLNGWSFKGYKSILKHSGKLLTDFVLLESEGVTFINVGLLGLLGTSYVLLSGSALNGPTIGGIMTLAGFGALGKHPKNIAPVVLGVILGAATNAQPFNSPSMTLAVLFGTTLAPIAGEFGHVWGVIAGFLHSALVINVAFLHQGMNLYNNGFSGGFVALFLLPLIEAVRQLKNRMISSIRGESNGN